MDAEAVREFGPADGERDRAAATLQRFGYFGVTVVSIQGKFGDSGHTQCLRSIVLATLSF